MCSRLLCFSVYDGFRRWAYKDFEKGLRINILPMALGILVGRGI